MTLTIEADWWLVPTLITAAVTAWAIVWCSLEDGGAYGLNFRPLVAAPVWLLLVLGSWLLWALL